MNGLLIVSLAFTFLSAFVHGNTSDSIDRLCTSGDLYAGLLNFQQFNHDAQALHCSAALELILNANVDNAVSLQKLGKSTDFTAIPPLAKRHLDGQDCAGLGDLFYVTAVIIKELVDTNKALPNVLKAMKTLVTLTSDSGLPHAGESLIQTAMALDADDASLRFRAAVMTPGVYESLDHIAATRKLLTRRIEFLADPHHGFALTGLDEFVMSPTFYFVYQGYNDRHLLTALQRAYIRAFPKLGNVEILSNVRNNKYLYQLEVVPTSTDDTAGTVTPTPRPRNIRVGFVSSHFRRHSICKLFCGIMTNLDPNLYDVYAFSSLQQNQEDKVTLKLRKSGITFVSIGMTFIQNRNEVTDRLIDILIYLDVGMDPSTSAWAAARLAPVQMVIWGHPSTTGFDSIDNYLSSQLYYKHSYQPSLPIVATPVSIATASPLSGYAQDFFLEQLVQFDTLGFYFERPQLDIDIKKIGATVTDIAADGADSQHHLPIINDATVTAAAKLALTYRPPSFFKALRNSLKVTKSSASKQLMSLMSRKTKHNTSIALIPQHMPKFHPHFDLVLTSILLEVSNSVIVLVGNKKKFQWRRMLMARWREKLHGLLSLRNKSSISETSTAGDINITEMESNVDTLLSRIVWLDSLTPSEYLTLLAIGDVMLDPFPFGGGVTTLESVAVCTPVVTLPSRQSVPQLAAESLLEVYFLDGLRTTVDVCDSLTVREVAKGLYPDLQLGLYEVEVEIGASSDHQLLPADMTMGSMFNRWATRGWRYGKVIVPLYYKDWHTPKDRSVAGLDFLKGETSVERELFATMREIKKLTQFDPLSFLPLPPLPELICIGTNTDDSFDPSIYPFRTFPSDINGVEDESPELLTLNAVKKLARCDRLSPIPLPVPPVMISESTNTPQRTEPSAYRASSAADLPFEHDLIDAETPELLTMSAIKRLARFDRSSPVRLPSPPPMVSESTNTPQKVSHSVGTEAEDDLTFGAIYGDTSNYADYSSPSRKMISHCVGTDPLSLQENINKNMRTFATFGTNTTPTDMQHAESCTDMASHTSTGTDPEMLS
eukprot:gene18552-21115_t